MKNDVILVCGGDGYIGWPLSFKLALTYPEKSIIIADNFSRRSQKTVANCSKNKT